MSSSNLASLRAAVIDGRAHNIFFRLEQLEKLHTGLVSESSIILEAIIADSDISRAEAKVEFSLALNALQDRYSELDPERQLDEEYAVTKQRDANNLRIGFGIVLIKPAKHSLFYSTVVALSAAIAAGNCVALEVSSPAIFPKLENADYV